MKFNVDTSLIVPPFQKILCMENLFAYKQHIYLVTLLYIYFLDALELTKNKFMQAIFMKNN